MTRLGLDHGTHTELDAARHARAHAEDDTDQPDLADILDDRPTRPRTQATTFHHCGRCGGGFYSGAERDEHAAECAGGWLA